MSPSTGLLTFPGVGTFAKPTAGDVFSCSTGPFGNYPDASTREGMGNIGARIAASLNRSTLLANPQQPDGEQVSQYYAVAGATNHYSRIVHEVNLDGRGYAFPYDDVVPSGSGQPEQAGTAYDGDPDVLTITLGSLTATANAAAREGEVKVAETGDDSARKAAASPITAAPASAAATADADTRPPPAIAQKQELRRRSLKSTFGSFRSRFRKALA